METIPIRYYREVWSLDRSWKSQVFQGTIQTQWITSKIVSQITKLWFHFILYSREDKYKNRYFVKKKSSEY